MTQHVSLDFGDPVHEGFFDPIQELLGTFVGLCPVVSSATALQLVASAENGQQSVAVQGRYRYRTTNLSASLPGSPADGLYDVFVTASDNDFTGPEADPDVSTDYSFAMEIHAHGSTPTTALYRQVAECDVKAAAIVQVRMVAGPRPRSGLSWHARAEHASQSALRVTGASGQTAPILIVERADGTPYATIGATGDIVLGTGVDLTLANDATIVLGDIVLSRAAADNLAIGSKLSITQPDIQLELLSGASGSEALLSLGRTAAEAELIVEASAGEHVTGSAAGDLIVQVLADGKAVWITGGTDGDLKITDGRVDVAGVFAAAGNAAVNGKTPAAPPSYAVTNVTPDRTVDTDATSLNELADLVGTIVADLRAIGWVA